MLTVWRLGLGAERTRQTLRQKQTFFFARHSVINAFSRCRLPAADAALLELPVCNLPRHHNGRHHSTQRKYANMPPNTPPENHTNSRTWCIEQGAKRFLIEVLS